MTEINQTLKERGSTHGSMLCNAQVTQEMLTVLYAQGYAGMPEMHRECLHMILHKVSRLVCGDNMNADSAHDIAGYATLLEKWIIENNDADI